jgi:hypothetical protein
MPEKTPDATRTPATEQLGAGRGSRSIGGGEKRERVLQGRVGEVATVMLETTGFFLVRRRRGGGSGRESAHSERKTMKPIMKRRRIPMNQSSIMMNMAQP